MKYGILFLVLILAFTYIKAQDYWNDSTDVENNILFFKDPRVDVLQKMYSYNKTVKVVTEKLIRVQVMQGSNRDEVFAAKTKFSQRFPGIPTYITYASPNFRLRAGEFASTQEAQKFLQQLKSMFPASFMIEEKTGNDKDKEKEKDKNKQTSSKTKTPVKSK
jgi:hypothetical protein